MMTTGYKTLCEELVAAQDDCVDAHARHSEAASSSHTIGRMHAARRYGKALARLADAEIAIYIAINGDP